VSLSVLVVGNGKPSHVSVTEADQLVHDNAAIWQKRGRRIKIIKGKRPRPKVRGLSCYIGKLAGELDKGDRKTRDVVRAFVNDQFQRREPVGAA